MGTVACTDLGKDSGRTPNNFFLVLAQNVPIFPGSAYRVGRVIRWHWSSLGGSLSWQEHALQGPPSRCLRAGAVVVPKADFVKRLCYAFSKTSEFESEDLVAHWTMPVALSALIPTQIFSTADIVRPLPVDLELVLAVDVSSSMDLVELQVQREGYAAALSHPAIASAIHSGQLGRIAVLYVEWGKLGDAAIVVDWTLLQSAEDVRQVSQLMLSAPIIRQDGTSISGVMEMASGWMEENDFAGLRRVIDISGDGPNNEGRPVLDVRAELAVEGIEVNGLPLMIKEPIGYFNIDELDQYYEDCVITGGAAFVIPVYDMESFEESLRLKLIMEIAGQSPTENRLWKVAITDCLIGEKLRWRFENMTGDTR